MSSSKTVKSNLEDPSISPPGDAKSSQTSGIVTTFDSGVGFTTISKVSEVSKHPVASSNNLT